MHTREWFVTLFSNKQFTTVSDVKLQTDTISDNRGGPGGWRVRMLLSLSVSGLLSYAFCEMYEEIKRSVIREYVH